MPQDAPCRCMTRNLPFGTGCAPRGQVLLLIRLLNDGGFGSRAAMGELGRIIGGRGGLVERTIRASSLQIERLRERAPLSPEEKSARAQVLLVLLFRNDNRLPQERLAAASYVIVGMITL